MSELKQTALYQWHIDQGAKMVPFAGYSMPVQYASGVLKEHLATRSKAGLFDVSHMGQVMVSGEDCDLLLETIFPADLKGLAEGQQCYSLLLNDKAGIIDDLMLCKREDGFLIVLNASRKATDLAYLLDKLGDKLNFISLDDHALLALQGPSAVNVLAQHGVLLNDLTFMQGRWVTIGEARCWLTRSGYTGEDGFEISVHNNDAPALATLLAAHPDVEPIGLGARDSLRLEAGLCLYGQDLTEDVTPTDASLNWAIAKQRRVNGLRPGGFIGSDIVLKQQAEGSEKQRIGLIGEAKTPIRAGTPLLDEQGNTVGEVTSGGFSPSLKKPIAMASVLTENASNTVFVAHVRGKSLALTKTKMPFVPANYYRG